MGNSIGEYSEIPEWEYPEYSAIDFAKIFITVLPSHISSLPSQREVRLELNSFNFSLSSPSTVSTKLLKGSQVRSEF